jgi:ATP-binding cassette subfamily C protein PrsD
MLGRSVGFLPQEAGLFDGTVAQNIARFNPDATAEGVVHAARLAGVHELITALPDGYSTQLGEGQLQLSAGQRQRVGLARALYGDPFLVILDEPNANLDADGDVLLSHAISNVRSRGGIVIVIAHRPSAIASVDQLLVIRDGWQVEFGPKQSVLESMTRNSNQIQSAAGLKVAHHA